jgi:hypothetical protein
MRTERVTKRSRKLLAISQVKGVPDATARIVKRRGREFFQITMQSGKPGGLIPIVGIAAAGVWSRTGKVDSLEQSLTTEG